MQPEAMVREAPAAEERVDPYAWYMLGVLILVYVFNFLDRQLLTILAPELKRDLGISDSDFGFLYGTAFGVFYALFGIPIGKMADRWIRTKLLALGLALWSAMTALSGLSRNFPQLGLARIGVGIGEAVLTPSTYSMISDNFPPRLRATALGIYSIGLYIGTGLSLFLGSSIVDVWNAAYPKGTAPLGLAGWQVAFLVVGLPGMLLALWVTKLREPKRGRYDGLPEIPPMETRQAWKAFFLDLGDVVPPFTFLGAARRGAGALAANIAMAAGVGAGAAALIMATGDWPQWVAFGIGCYAVLSWLAATRAREPEVFRSLLSSPSYLGVTLGYSLLSFVGYANFAFAPLYAIQELGAKPAEAGFMLGGIGAVAGSIGVIGGGIIADWMARDGVHARRVIFLAITLAATMVGHGVIFSTQSLPAFYAADFVTLIVMAASLGGSSGIIVNIVEPRLRGTAAAGFLLGTNLLGLALGPYVGGKISNYTGDLGWSMLVLLVMLPPALLSLLVAYRALPRRVGSATAFA